MSTSSRWSSHEDEVLRRNYPKHGPVTAFWDERIDRTRSAISSRAQKLGVFVEGYQLESWHDEIRNAMKIICGHIGCSTQVLLRELRTMHRRGDL